MSLLFNDFASWGAHCAATGEPLFEPLRAEVKRRAFRPAVEACRIVVGTLGSSAGMVGAVATFKQQRLGAV